MSKSFYSRYAVMILVLVCFFTPFIFRGARDALLGMKNDVRDWLPSRFQETADLTHFWTHFAGEKFIIVSWPGCFGDETDEAFHLFKRKLVPAVPPSKANLEFPAPTEKDVGSTWLARPYDFIGDKLGLFAQENDYHNWGGLEEKWLRGFENRWYYITPNGDLFEFQEPNAPVWSLVREIRNYFGWYQLKGKHLAAFGPVDGPWYYKNLFRLNAQLFRSVVTGPDVLAELTKESAGGVARMSEAEARRKLHGVLFGPDGKHTALVITATEAGRTNFHRMLGRGFLGKERGEIYRIAGDCGIDPDTLLLGGPPVDNVAIDEEGTITLVRLVSLCVILGITLAYLSFRSWLATINLFFTGGLAAVMSLAFVGWRRETTDAVMMSMPALVYVLGVSGAVHFVNYYREALEEHGAEGAVERAAWHAWKPAILCNLTTSFGLLSLYSAEVVPIQKFGLYSAIGVMATVILLFTFVPAFLQAFPPKLAKKTVRMDGSESWLDAFLRDYWGAFGGWIIRHYALVGSVCLLITLGVGYGVFRINTSVNLLELFDSQAKIIRDYKQLESQLGKLVPMEIVVKFTPPTVRKTEEELARAPDGEELRRAQLTMVDRMEAIARIQSVIDSQLGEAPGGAGVVGQSMSAATFASKIPTASDSFTRLAFDSRLLKERPELLKSDFFKIDKFDGSELWRVSLRVAAFKGVDYGDFVAEIKEVVEPVLAGYNLRFDLIQQAAKTHHPGAAGSAITVGIVVPDELARSAFPRPAFKTRSTRKGKTDAAEPTVATAPGEAADENSPEKAVPADGIRTKKRINHAEIFVRSLAETLRTARVRVQVITESKVDDEATQLDSCDRLVLVGRLREDTLKLLEGQKDRLVDGEAMLSGTLQAALHSGDSPAKGTSGLLAGGPATPARANQRPAISAMYTGVVPIVYKAQRTLLSSLIDSTMWSFLTITPLMIIVSRSISGGLVAMLPNALPVLIIFGAMGWMEIRVDIGSMMTASIALGVAVDDTIHYLTWFKEELERTGDRREAILGAYRRCATPTLQAATISGLGLSIFALSTFTPTQRFGYLMLAILFAGVVAELVFFPALLASPLGAVFKVSSRKQDGSKEPGEGDSDGGDSSSGGPATVPLHAATRESTKRIALM